MVYEAGYTWEGNVIQREVLEHSYLFYETYKTQYVHCYEWYVTSRPELTVSSEMFEGLEDSGIIEMLAVANQQLEDWKDLTFGIHNGSLDIEAYCIRNG